MSVRINGSINIRNHLRTTQFTLKNYRIVFYNYMARELDYIGAFIVEQARLKLSHGGRGLDTGLMKVRIGHILKAWNHLKVGIYEDGTYPAEYVNDSIIGTPDRDPTKKYAKTVHDNHPFVKGFLQDTFYEYAKSMAISSISEFNRKYQHLIR